MSRNELEEAETWAVRTFGLAELGDLRRTDRLVQLAAALARDPQSSLPASLRGEAETVGAYRFLNHAALTPEQILMPHWVQTRREAASREQVLMIGDATECNLSRHHRVQGAGPVGRSRLSQGFAHPQCPGPRCKDRGIAGMCISVHLCPAACPRKV